jgi:hypothetical protein
LAASTSVNLVLGARDWEEIIGIVANSADSDMQEIQFALSTYYRAQATKPQGTDSVTVTTVEDALLKIADYLYGNTVMNVTKDSGTSPFARIMTAIRAANNAADGYIAAQLVIKDAAYNATQNAIRKNGRRIILMKSYDNN